MDQKLFASYFTHHFLMHAVSSRPLMLILDGHSSYFTLDLIQSAAEQDVIIFCPNSPAYHCWQSAFGYQLLWPPKNLLVPSLSRLLVYQSKPCWYQISIFSTILPSMVKRNDHQQHHSLCSPYWHLSFQPKYNPWQNWASKYGQPRLNWRRYMCAVRHHSRATKPFTFFAGSCFTLWKKIRYSNGYDMYTDEDYVAWLQEVHPESLSSLSTIRW